MTGKVSKKTPKGYGFITPDDGSKDIFFHARSFSDEMAFDALEEGAAVSFEVESGEKGLAAVNIQVM